MRLTYDSLTWWTRVDDFTPSSDVVTFEGVAYLSIPRDAWDRLTDPATPPTYGLEIEREGQRFRLQASDMMRTARVGTTRVGVPLDLFTQVVSGHAVTARRILYLGTSSECEDDKAAGLAWAAAHGVPVCQTGWDLTDQLMREIPGLTRGQIWQFWSQAARDTTDLVVVGDGVIGLATARVIEARLGLGRPVVNMANQCVVRLAQDPETKAYTLIVEP